ncbi:uncharacterized protein LOC126908638 [Daktulosphaira vitifoliae]|uniref:uncharacterized protein LOC126908638 n=1 Tax=Daktulosphaira vitifoliae TaxID=58002 RepID=UPI0021AAE17F|nr:uncharacterized protein LOC126908638 [Daktulosphaira vitifoliae]
MYSGWKNLNDVNSIKFSTHTYYHQNLIEKPKSSHQYDKKVRSLTLYLGCTYVKVICNIFFSVIRNVYKSCRKKLDENDFINGYICTEGLINIISMLVVPMATLMKGAIDALDSLHSKPLNFLFRNYFMISFIFKKIENIHDELNIQTISRDDITTYYWTLNTVHSFSKNIIDDIKNNVISHCEFVPYDMHYLWKGWHEEYKIIINQDVKMISFNFLRRKIKNYIETVIKDKYFQLGFKFDPITEETYIERLDYPIELDLEFKASDGELPMSIQI